MTAQPLLSTFISIPTCALPAHTLGLNSAALIVADADELRIEVTEVRSTDDNERLTFALDDQGTTLRVNLSEAVAPGGSAEVLVSFKGSVPEIDPEETGITTHVIKQVSAALRGEQKHVGPRDINFRFRGLMLPARSIQCWRCTMARSGNADERVSGLIFNEVADTKSREEASGVMCLLRH